MSARAAVAAGVAALALGACHPHAGRSDVPAVLTRPTAESRAELLRVVREALHGAPVTLADDALTNEDTLLVDRVVRRDAEGRPLNGRETGRPERFRLVQDGTRCVLVHEGSGRRFALKSTTCAPR